MENITSGLNSLSSELFQFTENSAKLWMYLQKQPKHPNVIEHYGIASSFGVPNYQQIFRMDAFRRILSESSKEPLTAATISKNTGLTHKYICQLKRHLEKKGLIKVVGLGKCPTTGSSGVQFLSSEANIISELESNTVK